MENKPEHNIEIILIRHSLISCCADKNIKPAPGKGGNVEFVITIETPDSPTKLNVNDIFTIKIELDCTGKSNENQEIAFHASCKMEGTYKVDDCPKEGLITKDNKKLRTLTANQLFPVVAQNVSDMLAKMGYRSIQVPQSMAISNLVEKDIKKRKTRKVKAFSAQ